MKLIERYITCTLIILTGILPVVNKINQGIIGNFAINNYLVQKR